MHQLPLTLLTFDHIHLDALVRLAGGYLCRRLRLLARAQWGRNKAEVARVGARVAGKRLADSKRAGAN